jgi:PAS domain S-box-containing protein
MLVLAHHDHRLVVLSVVISIVAAYAASDLAERIRGARGRAWAAWLVGGAVVDGVGTWSMHYTGKLALRLPVPLQFDWRGVVLSLVVGIAGSFLALLIMSRGRVGWARATAAAIVLGVIGISGLHYMGMAAMRLPGLRVQYRSPSLVILSIVLAAAVSLLAIAMGFLYSIDNRHHTLGYHGAAVLRGLANPIMHFTAMAAVAFTASADVQHYSHAVSITSLGVIGVSIVPGMLLVAALLTVFADRLQTQRALLDQLFEQAPQAVALMSGDGRVVRINREFTRLFGFAPDEVLGRRLTDVMMPDDPGDRLETEMLALMQGERLEAERVRRRKDGTDAHVSIVGVPVSVPGEIATYAIYSDITEQKNAQEALRTFPQRLIETQEAERQRIARELHDEIGQVLTSAGIMLTLGQQRYPEALQAEIAEARSLLDDLVGRVRNLALDLRPSILDHFGLTAALSWFFERYTAQTGVRVAFNDLLPEDARFDAEIETTAYRIIQEALTNIARHAGVREATVSVSTDAESLVVEVEDRGTGFDRDRVSGQSFGLVGMRERTNILGGRLIVETSPGAGTRVIAELPL